MAKLTIERREDKEYGAEAPAVVGAWCTVPDEDYPTKGNPSCNENSLSPGISTAHYELSKEVTQKQ